MEQNEVSGYTEVVQVVQPLPRGWFSRLMWRWIRYDLPPESNIYLTIVPPPAEEVQLHAAWIETLPTPGSGEPPRLFEAWTQNFPNTIPEPGGP